MATTTTNLGLTKPAYADDADIAVINGNMDILDTKIGAVGNTDLQSQVTTLNDKIVTASFTYDAANAVFPLGNNPVPGGGAQITVPARNVNTGAYYLLWYKSVSNGFAIGAVLSGSAPSNNDMVFLQYFS